MAFNGSGIFSRLYSWATEQASSPIEISKLDTQEEDFATALSNCVLRDGTGVPSAATPWNSKRITGLGTATARTDAAQLAQIQDGGCRVLGSVSGTNTITGALTPTITAYAAGMMVVFTPAATNTGAVTLNIDSLGALDVLNAGGVALVGGELVINVPVVLVLDAGADDWIVVNPSPAAGSFTATLAGVSGSVTATVRWTKIGNLCSLYFLDGLLGTSNTISCSISGLPTHLVTSAGGVSVYQRIPIFVVDNGVGELGSLHLNYSGGAHLIFRNSGSFTTSGTKGISYGSTATYYLP